MKRSQFFSFIFLFFGIVQSHNYGEGQNPYLILQQIALDEIDEELSSNIQMVASPSHIFSAPAWVTLKLKGVQKPTPQDFIGIYASNPSQVKAGKHAPIRLLQATRFGEGYLSTGNAEIPLYIDNVHTNITLALLSNVTTTWSGGRRKVIIGLSNVITFEHANEPNQGHLAPTGKAGSIKLIWATGLTSTVGQEVRLGYSSGEYSLSFNATQFFHKSSDMCRGPATDFGWKDPGNLFVALMKGLHPGQTYYYSYGSSITGYSKERTFVAPMESSLMEKTVFGIVGDMGTSAQDGTTDRRGTGAVDDRAFNLTQSIEVKGLDMFMVIGDVSYAEGFGGEWEQYIEMMRRIAERVPFMTVTGNHEAADSLGECNMAYEKRYGQFMPKSSIDPNVQWYSYNQGPVRIVAISTEHNYSIGSEQYMFIKENLQRVNRKVTPFVIVVGHRPIYVSHRVSEMEMLKCIEPLLIRYQVDATFFAHVHTYQRHCPLIKAKCNPRGTVQVLVGSGGLGFSSSKPDGKYVLGGSKRFGYARVTATRSTFVSEYYNDHGEVEDKLVLKSKFN